MLSIPSRIHQNQDKQQENLGDLVSSFFNNFCYRILINSNLRRYENICYPLVVPTPRSNFSVTCFSRFASLSHIIYSCFIFQICRPCLWWDLGISSKSTHCPSSTITYLVLATLVLVLSLPQSSVCRIWSSLITVCILSQRSEGHLTQRMGRLQGWFQLAQGTSASEHWECRKPPKWHIKPSV